MPTCNSAITIQPNSAGEFTQTLRQDVVPPVNQRGCHGAVMRGNFGRRLDQFGASFRECWRMMMVMRAAFERSGDGARSRERSEERLRDEQAWLRMDGEGCPNGHEQIDLPSDIVGMAREATADMQRCRSRSWFSMLRPHS